GPIQVAEATWIIIRREGIIPGQPVNPKDEKIRKLCYEMIYEVKLKEAMSAVFVDLMRAAAIDNKLTGRVKLANEEMVEADGEVQLMGHQKPVKDKPPAPGPAGRGKLPPPVAASPEVIQQAESLQRPPVKK
ncbi:MAG: parvulin peptidyl-prolyl isomerase, partial [Planctomycetaceae bacterium]